MVLVSFSFASTLCNSCGPSCAVSFVMACQAVRVLLRLAQYPLLRSCFYGGSSLQPYCNLIRDIGSSIVLYPFFLYEQMEASDIPVFGEKSDFIYTFAPSCSQKLTTFFYFCPFSSLYIYLFRLNTSDPGYQKIDISWCKFRHVSCFWPFFFLLFL
jgi:hypothetical protein